MAVFGVGDQSSYSEVSIIVYDPLCSLSKSVHISYTISIFLLLFTCVPFQYYCDAAGELYDQFKKCGCIMHGFTSSTEGYEHEASKAERDGKFIGLMFDEDNQYDLSEGRAKAWVEQLKSEGFF